MAVLGEANIIVKAITSGVEDDIKRAFNKVGTGANNPGAQAGERVGRAFRQASVREAVAASKAFTRLMRVSMVLTGFIGALVGSIGTLVSGLIPLIGALGQAASTGMVLVNTMAAMKVASMVAKSAMNGISQAVGAASKSNTGMSESLRNVREEMQQLRFDAEESALSLKRAAMNLEQARENLIRVQDLPPNSMARRDAELSYQEAELAYRRTLDRNNDLREQLEKPLNRQGGGGAGVDPYGELTPSQKKFAMFLAGIQDRFKELRESAASGFLPLLETQIRRLMSGGSWSMLVRGYAAVGRGLGLAAEAVTDFIESSRGTKLLGDFFSQTGRILPLFGKSLATVRFYQSVIRSTDRIKELVNMGNQTGSLVSFFERAGNMAAQFGRILSNWFGGLGKLFGAGVGPGSGGQMLLDWMEQASARFKEIQSSFSKGRAQDIYFRESAENFKAMSQSLGKIFGAFKQLGDDPAIAEFYRQLSLAAPTLRVILQNAIKTLGTFGALGRALLEISEVFSDPGQGNAFFQVLADSAMGLAKGLQAIKPLLDFFGPLVGAVSAFGLLLTIIGKLSLVFKGFYVRVLLGLSQTKVGADLAATSFARMGTTAQAAGAKMKTAFLSNPVFIAFMVAAEIALLATAEATRQYENRVTALNKAVEDGATGLQLLDRAMFGVKDGSVELGRGSKSVAADLKFLGNAADELNTPVDQMGNVLYRVGNVLDRTVRGLFTTTGSQFGATMNAAYALSDGYAALGDTLGQLAGSDLEGAQEKFSEMADAQGMTRREQADLLTAMPKYREALLAQADALGINIRNADGTINGVKQLDFAMGEGEVGMLRAAAAAQEFSDKISGAAAEVVDLGGAIESNMSDRGKLNVGGLIKDLQKQATNAAAYQTNLAQLRAKGVGEAAIDEIIAMGPKEGAQAAAALNKASAKELSKLTATYATAADSAGTEFVDRLAAAQPQAQAVFKSLGQSGLDAFIKEITDGTSIDQAFRQLMGGIGNAPAIAGGKWSWTAMKTGGFVTPQKFAGGGYSGRVFGRGGPTADMVPAMLSAGEYVVNASATDRFLPMLQSMNNTSTTGNALLSTKPSAQATQSVATSSAGVTIVVNAAPGMDERALAEAVSIRLARQMRRGAV